MSEAGIRIFANVLGMMQETRGELLRSVPGTKIEETHKQDIRLAQKLEQMKADVSDWFAKETVKSLFPPGNSRST